MKGSQFKKVRERLGLSQEELAEVLCLSSKQAVSNIETGFRNAGGLAATLMRVLEGLSERQAKELCQLLTEQAQIEVRSRKAAE
jgi:transcriptional regulator with XRE-family HTH domain